MRVFLAHASAQQRECTSVASMLRAAGFTVFFSPDTIEPSDDFNRRIRSEIARCDLMVFLLSKESVTSGCYALTELQIAEGRWSSPRGRILPTICDDLPMNDVPDYLRRNIELFRPQGDIAAAITNAAVRLRNSRIRLRGFVVFVAGLILFAIAGGGVWYARFRQNARLDAITRTLLESARRAPIYLNTCVKKLTAFSEYEHTFVAPSGPCDPEPVMNSLPLPALVVSQTGYGKKGFMQTVRGILARRAQPSILVSYRDCIRSRPRSEAVELIECLIEKVVSETRASRVDAERWVNDPKRYTLFFDAIDDSASREHTFRLIQQLWRHQQQGGTTVMSSQPENLKYVLNRFGLEEWVVWAREQLPTVDVRGINVNSVRRIATEYEEHKVPESDISAILDFWHQCPDAVTVMREWVAQPKLFRERGTPSVTPVVEAIRKVKEHECQTWHGDVLRAMLFARIWSYCHDELCNYQIDGEKFLRIARRFAAQDTISEADLSRLAQAEGYEDVDKVAFPLLSTGPLHFENGKLVVDARWIPN